MAVRSVEKKTVVDLVDARVRGMMSRQEIHLPADYSPENALKSAWLKLQEVKDKEKQPVLQSCTQASIANSLFDMVIQGLNPAKDQCYFIAFGNQLACQVSYFGAMAIAKRVDPTIAEIVPGVVYEGDVFRYTITRGKVEIVEHQQELKNIDKDKIIAAYCEIIDRDGDIKKTEIMTFDEIRQSWRQSPVNPFDDKGNLKAGSTHNKFTAEMCKRTVTNRACKPIVNASSDKHLVQSFNRAADAAAEEGLEQEIAANANGEVIDIEGQVVEETDDKAEENTEEQPETEEKIPESEKNPPKNEQKAQEKDNPGQQTLGGPGF